MIHTSPTGLKLLSWNVNGIRARFTRLQGLLEDEHPDILCLQETRCPQRHFPFQALLELGYQAEHNPGYGAGGVAILVRAEHHIDARSLALAQRHDIAEGRWLQVNVAGLCFASVYVPTGSPRAGASGDQQKLAFLAALARHGTEPREQPLIMAGDFNVAPEDQDIYEPQWLEGSYHSAPAERAALHQILHDGQLLDTYRELHPDEEGYTCWEQREGHYPRDYGLRIDLILIHKSLRPRLTGCDVLHAYRQGKRPSDHAALTLTLD